MGPQDALSYPRGQGLGQDSGPSEGRVRLGPIAPYCQHVGKLRQAGERHSGDDDPWVALTPCAARVPVPNPHKDPMRSRVPNNDSLSGLLAPGPP